uniref:Phospholipase A2 n=1 Tax=Panstrongylus lignarius TaxID=156445 RepID=A0A224XFH7_9HEMI
MKTPFIIFILFYIPYSILASIRAVTTTLPDGEIVTYLRRGPISAKQTSIRGLPKDFLMVRQLTNGRELVQAIYSEGRLIDCDLSSRKIETEQIEAEINHMMSTLNTTVYQNGHKYINWSANIKLSSANTSSINSSWQVPRENLRWLDISKLTRQCITSHDRIISSIMKSRSRRSLLSIKPRRHSRNKVQKSRHDHLAKGKKIHLKQKLISPGTKWCGPSNRALRYGELGGFWQADRCCRKHDTCKLSIAPFSNEYSSLNTGPFTLSHCSCDRRFRNCLKMADTGASNLVGKLFFNVVQTKCFVLKAEKICTKRSWWGKCQKHEYKKLAHIRNNLSY